MVQLTELSSTEEVKKQWGWFVALGVAVFLLGIMASVNSIATTLFSVIFLGAVLFATGICHIIYAFKMKGNSERGWVGLIGLCYILAGALVAWAPLAAAIGFTLFIGGSLFVSGVSRIVFGFQMRPINGWVWVIVSGIVTLLLSLIILFQWPFTGFVTIGLFLGVDLMICGVSLFLLGLNLKKSVI